MIQHIGQCVKLSIIDKTIEIQPILNHGIKAWLIYKPNGDYIAQFNSYLAARTALKWSNNRNILPSDNQLLDQIKQQIELMHQPNPHSS